MLDELKKEWEELGYEFIYYGKDFIQEALARNKEERKSINFYTSKRINTLVYIDLKMLQLLTKTFKALGWE